jgi:predicted regulator of Ras-like GTPase activity (Roadblock/LC7/MglB family)
MEERLAELNRVVGVRGSFVCGTEGQILAQAMPDSVTPEQLALAASVISQTLQALGMSRNRATEMDLLFGQGRLLIKCLRGGILVLLCESTINLPLVNLNANAVARKLSAELKPRRRPPAATWDDGRARQRPVSPATAAPEPIPAPRSDERFFKPSAESQDQPAAESQAAAVQPEIGPRKDVPLSKNLDEAKEQAAVRRGAAAEQAEAAPLGDGPLSRRLKRRSDKSDEAPPPVLPIVELRPDAETAGSMDRDQRSGEVEAAVSSAAESSEQSPAASGEMVKPSRGTTAPLIPPELLEQDREARRLIAAAQESGLTLRALGTIAVHWHCHQTHPWLRVPAEYRTLEFCGLAQEAAALSRCLTNLDYEPNPRLNTFYANRRLTFDAHGWRFQVRIFLDAFDLNQHLAVSRHLKEEPFSLPPTLLWLTRLQAVDMTEAELRELSALCLDHELQDGGPAPDTINLSFIRNLCAEDWAWYKTAQMNLARLNREAAGWLEPGEAAKLDEWVKRLQSNIEKAPKSLRWRMRALRGESQRWYQVPEQ